MVKKKAPTFIVTLRTEKPWEKKAPQVYTKELLAQDRAYARQAIKVFREQSTPLKEQDPMFSFNEKTDMLFPLVVLECTLETIALVRKLPCVKSVCRAHAPYRIV
jgi:hypothetical protein